jgi:hypothetical protein
MSNEQRVKDYTHKFILFSSHPAAGGSDNKGLPITEGNQYDALVVMADQEKKKVDLTKIKYRSMTAGGEKTFSDYESGVFLPDEGNWELTFKSGAVESYARNVVSYPSAGDPAVLVHTLSSILLLKDAVMSIVSD